MSGSYHFSLDEGVGYGQTIMGMSPVSCAPHVDLIKNDEGFHLDAYDFL